MQTPLHYSANNGFVDVVDILLKHKAKRNAKDKDIKYLTLITHL